MRHKFKSDKTAHADRNLSEFEFEVLSAFLDIPKTEKFKKSELLEHKNGWISNVEMREFLNSPSLATRTALRSLALHGFVSETASVGFRQFRISHRGLDRIKKGPTAEDLEMSHSAQEWTGTVEPIQAEKALNILSELEDACEKITNNAERAQVLGLVRSLEILLTVPEPPRAGIVALVRDPAFANFVQLAAFFAALIAAIKA